MARDAARDLGRVRPRGAREGEHRVRFLPRDRVGRAASPGLGAPGPGVGEWELVQVLVGEGVKCCEEGAGTTPVSALGVDGESVELREGHSGRRLDEERGPG